MKIQVLLIVITITNKNAATLTSVLRVRSNEGMLPDCQTSL